MGFKSPTAPAAVFGEGTCITPLSLSWEGAGHHLLKRRQPSVGRPAETCRQRARAGSTDAHGWGGI